MQIPLSVQLTKPSSVHRQTPHGTGHICYSHGGVSRVKQNDPIMPNHVYCEFLLSSPAVKHKNSSSTTNGQQPPRTFSTEQPQISQPWKLSLWQQML